MRRILFEDNPPKTWGDIDKKILGGGGTQSSTGQAPSTTSGTQTNLPTDLSQIAGYDPNRNLPPQQLVAQAPISAGLTLADMSGYSSPTSQSQEKQEKPTTTIFTTDYLRSTEKEKPATQQEKETGISATTLEKKCAVTDNRFKKECPNNSIKKFCGGDNVKAVQLGLLANDPDSLPKFGPDCRYGNETKNAVKKFQKEKGIPATGTVDEQTYTEITKLLTTRTPAPVVAPTAVPTAPTQTTPDPEKKEKESRFNKALKALFGINEKRNQKLEKLVFERLVKGCK